MVKKVKKAKPKNTKTFEIAISPVQLKKAVKVLKGLIKLKQDPSDLLVNEDEFINMNIEVNRLPELSTLRVVSIPIPFSIYSKKFNSRVFLIVKDPQRSVKEKLDTLNIKDLPISKVCSISKLGKNYSQFKDRRELIRQYDLFLSDIRVFNMLPDRLGKYFYTKKKIPALISMDEDIESSLRSAVGSTFLIAAKGPIFTIKIGRLSMPETEIAENAKAVVKAIPQILPGISFENIRRLDIKGEKTLNLPIYNHLTPEEVLAYKS